MFESNKTLSTVIYFVNISAKTQIFQQNHFSLLSGAHVGWIHGVKNATKNLVTLPHKTIVRSTAVCKCNAVYNAYCTVEQSILGWQEPPAGSGGSPTVVYRHKHASHFLWLKVIYIIFKKRNKYIQNMAYFPEQAIFSRRLE